MDDRAEQRARKYANRRKRLRRLISERAENNADFARMYGFSRAQIGQYLSETYQEGRSPGEGVIEKLEDRTGVEVGWFDLADEGAPTWPFKSIDEAKVRVLDDVDQARLEAAILIAAGHVGLNVKK